MRSLYSLIFAALLVFAISGHSETLQQALSDEGCNTNDSGPFCEQLAAKWKPVSGDLVAKCSTHLSLAQTCCGSNATSFCQNQLASGTEAARAAAKHAEVTKQIAELLNSGEKTGSQKACNLDEELKKTASVISYGVAGVCRAQIGLLKAECPANKLTGTPELVNIGNQIKEEEKAFADGKKRLQDGARSQASNSELAKLCKNSSSDLAGKDPSSKPSGPGGSSDTPNSGSPGGSGGGNPMGGFNPASMMNNQQPQPTPPRQECSQNPMLAGCDCVTNPNQDHCKKSDSFNVETASVQESGSVDANNFNVPDAPISSGSGDEDKFVAEPAKVNPVAGNGTPFGLGGSGAASLPGGQNTGGFGIQPSKTDIMRGEGGGGGGFAAMAAGMNMKSGEEGGGYGGYNGAPKPERLNLSDWLPGGAKDPTRKLAGQGTKNVEISNRNVNMYERITNAINRRCAEGRLKDCVPYK